MVSAGDFRNGLTVEIEGELYQIIDFQHVKPGKGAAFVRTKIKNVISGGVVERTFNPTDRFENGHIDRATMQYLYNDGEMYVFMDTTTYEQTMINMEDIVQEMRFVKENEEVKVCSYKGKVFSVEPPITVVLEVTETEPGFKGNTATGARKPAIVETGVEVMVPLFIEQGEMIKIDTRTGEYSARA
ncbi:MAG: elongation factor P [Lachnospiraceae bacterium]|jgi:elongation factor P